jgi:hypothetical protein
MLKFLLVLILGQVMAWAGPREEAIALLSLNSPQTLTARIDFFSSKFIGLPYGDGGPLGEGAQGRYDQDPLYRFDTFDCTTYVETVLSLALTRHVTEFEEKMDDIRYENGVVDYLKRNHFPSLQWIPNNIANGTLKEINHLVLPKSEWLLAEAVINLPGWLKKIKIEEIKMPNAPLEERQERLLELQAEAAHVSPMMARLNYLPISILLTKPEVLKNIPHGAIVNFVRPNWDLTDLIGTHMNVSHQGFVFKKGKDVYLRHASSGGDKRVTETLLLDYLKKYENHPSLKGIHLMQIAI